MQPSAPPLADRRSWQRQVERLRLREKLHTREGDAIAAARRRLPMVEVDPATRLIGTGGEVSLLDTFEGRTQLIGSYHMWHAGSPASEQCEGCTFFNGQVLELSYLHSRDVTFAVFCQGPIEASSRYRDFMGWQAPWYSVPPGSIDPLLAGRAFGMKACYLRVGGRVFETYWTTGRGAEVMAPSYGLLDMTVYGRQEDWEDSPKGWPQGFRADGDQFRANGRPTSHWARLAAGRNDDLGGETAATEHHRHSGHHH